MSNIERALATIRTIKSLTPIEGADRIELAKFTSCGWQCVVNKGLYKIGDMVVFCEIDSWIPDKVAPFLTKTGQFPKEYNGVPGQRLKSIKLKGTLSQGLVLPLTEKMSGFLLPNDVFIDRYDIDEGFDVTQLLEIQKWERPISNSGKNGGSYAKPSGGFPTHLVSKTDQERIQNCSAKVAKQIEKEGIFEAEATEKLDGSSMTMLVHSDQFMVCSRNNKLKEPTPEDEGVNNFWTAAYQFKDRVEQYHKNTGRSIAIQGELVAHNIQGNPYKLKDGEVRFYAFDIFDIDEQRYLSSPERLHLLSYLNIPSVPVLAPLVIMVNELETIDDLCQFFLDTADGISCLAQVKREGVVFKSIADPSFSWKAISNSWLLSGGEDE